MKKFILGGMTAMVMAFSANAMAADFVAGKDYTVVQNPGKPEVAGKIEVREFFWYGCPHCFKLEPHMQAWLRKIPSDVNFIRTPAAMNKLWEQGARAYYVSEALGVRKRTHLPLFHANGTGQQILQKDEFAKFFTKYGVPEAKFNSMYNSFAITAKVSQANKLAQQYQLSGVPAVVVNGKYVVQGEDQKVVQVVEYLINKERK
ncbi:thiol:disulfide interchange protein DsbA/DsbL [Acinetobacter sichuanensis]|uniref:Thiol:disulfide interchange protein n=1 Tax=Acinetobacter sichuanensis TaxID=2136183 RepID=A0A371YMP0_9GAMM|nr:MULTISPECIES: thiol:disulfide interchange protein DsbA/DsbL [Acinetobacter]MDM1248703.1 DsbA family protein [Acinetobacter sp. R933-2]MDM1765798.1 DsbA family protein [Acinetobacter sp. 226-1]MDM1769560.1 DsbA family protein [Acinetobacter sp. 226-4]RFC82702.1 thiol:disulfide interchange protein DsbA/DsbL [Acinetobacter sichuanensis]